MPGSLNDVLPEPVSPENEQVLDQVLKGKLKTACNIAVELLHAMETHFGPEARDVLRAMAENRQFEARQNPGPAADDLEKFCNDLDQGCAGTHRWERLHQAPDRISYRYTRCMWAEIFRELGEPDIGFLLCAGDQPGVEAFNPELGFARSRVLMHGDADCDHIFYVKGK